MSCLPYAKLDLFFLVFCFCFFLSLKQEKFLKQMRTSGRNYFHGRNRKKKITDKRSGGTRYGENEINGCYNNNIRLHLHLMNELRVAFIFSF